MSYVEYITKQIEEYKIGIPIYTKTIADGLADYYHTTKEKASAATSVAMKRIIERKVIPELRKHKKGVYYLTKETPFGETGIMKENLINDKYLCNNNGYYTGYYLLYHIGLTTQIPNKRMIATNAVKYCIRYDKNLDVYLVPPKTRINSGNIGYLQILDVLDLFDKAPIDTHDPYKLIGNQILKKGLRYETLLSYADNYYNKNTVIQVAHTASFMEGNQ